MTHIELRPLTDDDLDDVFAMDARARAAAGERIAARIRASGLGKGAAFA